MSKPAPLKIITDEQIENWSLEEYLAALNEGGANLATDHEHWHRTNVYTARDLAKYLDGCVEREHQKGNIVEDAPKKRASELSLVTTRTERGIECMYEDEVIAVITRHGVTYHVQVMVDAGHNTANRWFHTMPAAEYYALTMALEYLAINGKIA